MKAQLIDIGRNKVNKTIEVKDEAALHKEIGKHILSKGWGMEETVDPTTWHITSGFRVCGIVKILQA